RHAEERRGHDADARRALRRARLSRLRKEARRAVRLLGHRPQEVTVMNQPAAAAAPPSNLAGPKPKKSVALSGIAAGNTALCTVGRTGNDLHYRGYDILEIANTCEFEEIAFLLVHGKLPNRAELTGYKAKLKSLRGLPAVVRTALETLPANAHPMD